MTIHTVLGELDSSTIGRVLPHEHLLVDFSTVSRNNNHVLNDVDLAVDELALLQGTGVDCLVEVTLPGVGRNPEALRAISKRSNVSIVMGSGWYRSSYHPPEIDTALTDALADQIVGELTEGFLAKDGSRIPAGVIGEIGVQWGFISAREERVFRAAARASNRTNAPVTTHTGIHPIGVAQLELLMEEKVDPSRIIIGHADMFLDLDYHRTILRSGAYLQFDTAGRNHINPDSRRASALVALVREGWLEQLTMSSDRCYRSDLVAFGGAGYAHTVVEFAAQLQALGLEHAEIDILTRTNPLRALSW
jgi:phosphotriesterase-related protein